MRIHVSAGVVLLTLGIAVFTGCGSGDDGNPSADGAAPAVKADGGYAAGRVTMPDGKVITAPGAAVTVVISGVSEAGERVSYTPALKPDGTYKQKLAAGSYRFERCEVEVDFEGKRYSFPVEPVGNDHNKNRDSADGITQDFVWKPTGETPGGNKDINNHTHWYGGSIGVRFNGWRNDINKAPTVPPEGTTVTFTLKPTTATRVDGSPASPITLERKFDTRWKQCDALYDIPAAHYELTGVAKLPDGSTKPLLFETSYAKFERVQPIRFDPDSIMDHVTTPLTAWVMEE